MKIRSGFVSNSSSSSFLIYGTYIDADVMDCNKVEEKLKGSDFEIEYGEDSSYGVYIGESWDNIGDDETGFQFKKRITEELQKIFGPDIETKTLSASWYSG